MARDYDLIVIGAGSAGLTAAGAAAHLGARTLLVEKSRHGGDCTWTGCIPSKALLAAAKTAHIVGTASQFGISAVPVAIDFQRVMEVISARRQHVFEEADSPEVFRRMGVDVLHGRASFSDSHTIAVDGEHVSGRYFVIATGGTPSLPPVDGLDRVPYLTTESVFEIRSLPAHLLIVGAGPVGVELGQAFRRLGSEVTVLDESDRILTSDEPELAISLRRTLEGEGIRFALGKPLRRADTQAGRITIESAGGGTYAGDALLVAAGRRPALADLNLPAAGVRYGEAGIEVDERCRTNVSHIFAAGDVTGRFQFTHMSEHMARIAVLNALLKLPSRMDSANVPWVTFTDPELAHVGATEAQLRDAGQSYQVYRFPYAKLDRAVTDARTKGEIKVLARRVSGRILGASVLGARAGELISELALAMRNGISLRRISDTIHPYPTYGLGIRRVADQWYVRMRTRRLVAALKSIMKLRGPVHELGPDDIL